MASLEVNIWGEKMRISSEQDESFIVQVADYLNEKMKSVQQSDVTELSTKIVALRAAYFIAAEYLRAQNELATLEKTTELLDKKLADAGI